LWLGVDNRSDVKVSHVFKRDSEEFGAVKVEHNNDLYVLLTDGHCLCSRVGITVDEYVLQVPDVSFTLQSV
jgi:hypothetical protein